MPSLSYCTLVPLACGALYSGAARKPCIPVSSLTPRAEEPIDEPLAWPIGLSPLTYSPGLAFLTRLGYVPTLLDSARLCST
jgi:hypothetical protein